MITITILNQMAHFEVNGLHKLWSFKSSLTIPLAHIVSVEKDPEIMSKWPGWRAPGTSVPFIIRAGTFHHHGNLIFWDVMHANKTIVVNLKDEDFAQLVIEVEDPDKAIALLTTQ